MLLRGRVVSFDRNKGYGFLAPDTGGEDVFVHVNDLLTDKSLMMAGSIVEFELDQGERGPKASSVRLVTGSRAAAPPVRQARSDLHGENDDLCDVLTAVELQEEVTELLLRADPPLTGVQILDLRQRFATLAHNHGWTED